MKESIIYVYADWLTDGPVLMGQLFVTNTRGKENFSFEFDKNWLKRSEAFITLDPDIHLYSGRQYVSMNKPIFGLFSDSCPDRWGRRLMQRREAIVARKEDRKPRALTECDYLLGVYDETRMGALRFSLKKNGPFLSADKELTTPPWVTLRKLENASYSFEGIDIKEEERWVTMLLAPGSSLGGARPKASVLAPDGSLWIAKFPSKHDEMNSGAWEIVTHDLAARCGLNVPDAKMENFSKNGSTFLIKRFDRDNSRRIHFASAMTLLGKTDGDHDASYLDIASFIRANGATPQKDLKELWKRVVFNMAVSNVDDHLRNHGFLLGPKGWELSPLYDVNPSMYGNALSLNVSQYDGSIDFDLALQTAECYDIAYADAQQYIKETKEIVDRNWRTLAANYGLSRSEIERMEPAFMATKNTKSLDELISNGDSTNRSITLNEGRFRTIDPDDRGDR